MSRFTFSLIFMLSFTFINLKAQQAKSGLTSPEAVKNAVIGNPNAVIITGKLIDNATHKAIKNAKINFTTFGNELLNVSVDTEGNYALALDKEQAGKIFQINFKVNGYKKLVTRAVNKNSKLVNLDLFLTPNNMAVELNEAGSYKLSDDPFNKLVIQF